MSNFIQLKALAKNTVGSSCDYLIDLMLILLELYDQFNSKVDHLDNQIKECIRGIDPPCLSLPGIGELSAAILLSESGDFSKLQNPSKMLSFAGLEPGHFQSGQSEFIGHRVKHGSYPLNLLFSLLSISPLTRACFAVLFLLFKIFCIFLLTFYRWSLRQEIGTRFLSRKCCGIPS